jgi:hypothetical protein
MLNFEEIPSSLGNSSLLMESGGHKIPFSVENILGNFFSHFFKYFSEQFLSYLFYFALQILHYLFLLSTQTLHFFDYASYIIHILRSNNPYISDQLLHDLTDSMRDPVKITDLRYSNFYNFKEQFILIFHMNSVFEIFCTMN